MVEEIVFGNKSATSWECEPRKTKMGVRFFYFPKIGVGCKRKGVRCFADRNGAVFACFLCFWKPQKLYAKPNVLLNTLPHILHQVCGLAVQHIANLLQRIHRQVLDRTHADGRHSWGADACPLCQFLLGHATHGKHYFDFELNHSLSLLPSGHCITHFVVNQYAKRKIFRIS